MLSMKEWANLTRALEFYRDWDFEYIAAPWHASETANRVTLPPGVFPTLAVAGSTLLNLVGSAEQSFLDLWQRGLLPDSRHVVALTPCFRLADDCEATCHHPYFVKVELGFFVSWSGDTSARARMEVLTGHAECFRERASEFIGALGGAVSVAPRTEQISRREAANGFLWEAPLGDLEIGGVEVGSYGVRAYLDSNTGRGVTWAYGTGLAEPRTSWAIERSRT